MSDDLLAAFVEEARELLEQASDDLSALARAPEDAAALEGLFRAAHTLKGSGGLIGFTALEHAFHAAEDRLSEVRQGARRIDDALVAALSAAVDQAELWVEAIALQGQLPGEAETEAAALVARLETDAAAEPDRESAPSADWADALRRHAPARPGPMAAFRYTPAEGAYFAGDDPAAIVRAVPDLVYLRVTPRVTLEPGPGYDPFTCNLVFEGLSGAALPTVQTAFRFVSDQVLLAEASEPVATGDTVVPRGVEAPGRTLRVDAARVDALAAGADDLVVAKNALSHLLDQATAIAPPALARSLTAAQADLDRRVARLHESIGRMRLVPLAPLVRRFPPIVRQLASGLGKSVELVLSGEGVEVDKSIADGLHEPLLHLLRNALDHGIELPAERRAAGKAVPAVLRLSAVADGDEIVIELADDGRGLDIAAVRAAAERRGLASSEALAAMPDDAAADLIFQPGFSTAGTVTQLSGRGVGLDAVRARAAALGGRVSVHSVRGRGARFVLRLPVRVRLARLMMVEAAGETYGVPLESVVEATHVAPDRLTPVRTGRAMVWRDRPVPLLSLSDLLKTPQAEPGGDLKVMIVRSGDELTAVSVDRFGDRIEAPLRPLAGVLARVPGVLGSSLLGDGRVLMVLDIPELIG